MDTSKVDEIVTGLNRDDIQDKLIAYNESFDTYFSRRRSELQDDYRMFREFFRMVKQGKGSKTTESFNRIMTAQPFIVSSVAAKSQVVEAKANFADPDNEIANRITKVINSLILRDDQRGYIKLTQAIQNVLWAGTSIGKSFFNEDTVPTYNPDIELGYEEVSIDKPDFKTISVFDFAHDPNTTSQDFNEIAWCRDRVYVTKGELYLLREKGLCDFNDVDLEQQADGSTYQYNSGKNIRDRVDHLNFVNKKLYYDEFYFDHIYKDETGSYKKLRMYGWLMNNRKLIKLDVNRWGRKPYFAARAFNYDKEFWGVGLIDVISTFVKQLEQIHLHTGTLVDKSGKTMLFHTPAAGMNALAFRDLEAGAVMLKNIGDQAIRTEPQQVDKALGSLVNYNNGYLSPKIDAATGITPLMSGFSAGDTATESTILNNNAFARLSTIINDFLHSFIVEMANNYYVLLKNKIASQTTIFVNGENITLTPEDFKGDFTFKAVGSVDQANRNLRARQLNEYFGMLTQVVQSKPMFDQIGFPVIEWFENEVNPLYGINRSYFNKDQTGAGNPGLPPQSMPNTTSPLNNPAVNSSQLPASVNSMVSEEAAQVAAANNPMVG